MQQRQLRLGDILDDYCPRERRVTNHAVVAMVGPDVKQTRCTTCDSEHEYKHAKIPRQRRKSETPAALYSAVLAGGPKRVSHDPEPAENEPIADTAPEMTDDAVPVAAAPHESIADDPEGDGPGEHVENDDNDEREDDVEEGPVHRPLIRATLPRAEGQPPPTRPAPDFTIRQPGRGNRFRPRHPHGGGGGGGQSFHGNRSNGNMGGGRPGSNMPRHGGGGGGRPPMGGSRTQRHNAKGRRQK